MTVPHSTHEVRNQVPPLTGYDVADDATLLAAAGREGLGRRRPARARPAGGFRRYR